MIWYILGLILAFAFGVWTRGLDNEDCPRAVLHYNCKGKTCNHDPILLWTNLISMENQRRQKEAEARGMAYNPDTQTYYDPKSMTVTKKDGVVSFRSKS